MSEDAGTKPRNVAMLHGRSDAITNSVRFHTKVVHNASCKRIACKDSPSDTYLL